MRVLHVLEALEGGTARHLRDLVRWTPDVEQHVAVPPVRVGGVTDEAAIPEMRAAGATVHLVPMTRFPLTAGNVRSARTLRRLIREVRPDLVHAHSSIAGALARPAAIGTGVPVVYTPHGLHDSPLARILERLLGPLTARLVAVSPSEADVVRARRLVPADRVATIPNAVDPESPPPVDLRAVAGVPTAAPVVAYVGRLIAQKAPLDVVETMRRVLVARPDVHAVLVADGPLASAVDAAVATGGVADRVHRIANLPGAAAALGSADVVLLLSVFEGAPYVPLEALRAGTPVVATAVTGNRDAVRDGVDGFLVPPADLTFSTGTTYPILV